MRFYIPFFLIWLASSNPAFSSAWVLEGGEEFVIQSLYTYDTDTFVDSEGHSRKASPYRKRALETYIEYGLTDTLTLGGLSSYQVVEQDGLKNMDVGNTEFFLRSLLYQNSPHIFSTQFTIKLPSMQTGLYPQIGTQGWDAQIDLLYARNFNAHFMDTGIGFRKRFDINADQLKWHAKYGHVFNEKWMLTSALYGTHKIGGISDTQTRISVENDYHLIKSEITIHYAFSNTWGVHVGGYRDMYSRNTGKGCGAIFGVWRRF